MNKEEIEKLAKEKCCAWENSAAAEGGFILGYETAKEHLGKHTQSDIKHLIWLKERIVNVYGESENVDFIIKFGEIIDKLRK